MRGSSGTSLQTDADNFFKELGQVRSERTLVMIKSTLRRSIRRARVHNLIARNVVELVDRKSGDTETPKSKRPLELPKRAIAALT